MPSKSKFPASGRKTIEVDTSWLVEEARSKEDAPLDATSKKNRPPPIPGAKKNAPPMPVTPPSTQLSRRVTVEVKAEWLEEARASEPPPSKKRASRTSVVPPSAGVRKKKGPPIPRED